MKENELTPAPFDEKNLSADSLRDNIFGDFYDQRFSKGRKARKLGHILIDTDKYYIDGYVSVEWSSDSNTIVLELLACPCEEDFFSMTDDFLLYYTEIFKEWECPDNEGLVVKCNSEDDKLYVSFYFKTE